MKKFLSVFLLVLAVLACLSFTACGDPEPEQTPDDTPTGGETTTDEAAHYLHLIVDGNELAVLLVLNTDTYEELSIYFPLIPEEEGYTSYWEEKEVYSETENEIYLYAYYVKK